MKINLSELRAVVQEVIEEIDPIQVLDEKEGKKDACYHKVKSRYKVWLSAYASGALVKLRSVPKTGAIAKKKILNLTFFANLEKTKLVEKNNPRIPRKRSKS